MFLNVIDCWKPKKLYMKKSPIILETSETSIFYGWNPYKSCLNPLVIQLGAPDRIAQAQREAQPAKNNPPRTAVVLHSSLRIDNSHW